MRHRLEPRFGHTAIREQVIAMRVVSRGDEHELWLERVRERYDDVLDERHPDLVPGSCRHRQVDREAPALPSPTSEAGPVPGNSGD